VYSGCSRALPQASAERFRPSACTGNAFSASAWNRFKHANPHTFPGGLQSRLRGRLRVQMHAYLVAAAYNLIRMAKLSPVPA